VREWQKLLSEACAMSLRNRLMLALAYDAGSGGRNYACCILRTLILHSVFCISVQRRRKEIVIVSFPIRHVRAAASWLSGIQAAINQRHVCLVYLRVITHFGIPITIWTWSRLLGRLATSACLPKISTHTLRHLCLTDLARSGWDCTRSTLPGTVIRRQP